jgi:hypothetical protein
MEQLRATDLALVVLVALGVSCSSKGTPESAFDAECVAVLNDPDSLALAAVEWRSLALADSSITPIVSGAVTRNPIGFRDLPLKVLLADRSIWRVPNDSDSRRRYGYHARFTRHGVPVDVLAGEDVVAVARDGKILVVADMPWDRAFNSVPMHITVYIE